MPNFAALLFNGSFRILAMLAYCVGDLQTLTAQNLVPNPSFEVYSPCPTGLGNGGPLECAPWTSGATPDYFNACSDPMFAGVPGNFFGYQPAHTGVAYTGVIAKYSPGGYREYIIVSLLEPLDADTCYKIGFWINQANNGCGINKLGAYLSQTSPNPFTATPQLEWSGQFFSDTINWVHIFGYYTALGGEAYISIGNFEDDAGTQWDPACEENADLSYFYIDDVYVESIPAEPIDVDLDGPITTCDSFLIDPELQGDIVYHWSTGSETPTLTVYTSGTYSVTVYYGCNEDEASIEVTLLGSTPIDLGPDFILCEGDTYTISLDPDAGNYEWQDGSNNPEYTITSAGTYSVTLDNGCEVTSDEIIVSPFDLPLPFTLGADTFLCPGDDIMYQFDPSLGEFLWQDGSTESVYEIDEEGSYSLTISNMCGEQTDEIEIIYIPPPEFSLGPDSITLCDGEDLELEFDPGMGDFLWQDGSSEPVYSIETAGNYYLTVTNECGTLSDAMHVSEMNNPFIVFGPDIQVCNGETVFLDASNNTGNFEWQDGSTQPIFIVTTSGTYSVSITNDCGFDTDDISILFNSPVTPPDLGPDINLCPGQEIVFNVSSPDAQYIWNDSSTGDTLLVDTSGTYYVEVFNACSSFTDTVIVTMSNNPPELSLPADFEMCQGQSTQLDAGISGVSYLWNDGSTFPQLTVTSAGLYTLTVTNACGTDMDSVVISDGGLAPSVSFGLDTSICPGSSIILAPLFSNVDSWVWPDGSTQEVFETSTPGVVYVNVANSCGSANDSISISLLPATPPLSLGADTSICPGESLTLSIQIPGVNILWTDGSTDQDFIVTDSMIVLASISNVCGISMDTMLVSLLPGAPSLNLGQDQSICPGEVITLNPGITGVSYLWQDGTTDPVLQITQGIMVTLVVTNSCGSATDTIEITESTLSPQLDLGPDLTACVGDVVTIPAGISGVNYLWQDGNSSSQYVTSISGTFILTVQNLCGSDSDTINVDISGLPPAPNLGQDTSICEGESILLSSHSQGLTSLTWQDGSASATLLATTPGTYWLMESNSCGSGIDSLILSPINVPSPFDLGPDTTLCNGNTLLLTSPLESMITYLWQDGSSSSDYLITGPGLYSLNGTNQCGNVFDSILITFIDLPSSFDLGPDTILCPGETFVLSAPSTTDHILWQDGSSAPTIIVDTSATYILQISNACGVVSDELIVSTDQNQPVLSLPPTLAWCEGDILTLDATQSFDVIYSWSTGDNTSAITIESPGIYTVDVYTVCTSISQEVEVITRPGCEPDVDIFVPNIFSPNGDQINDLFSISFGPAIELLSLSGTIFDRWGNMIFQSTDIPFTWDGHFKNETLMPGVYVYVVEIKYNVGGIEYDDIISGDVTLVH